MWGTLANILVPAFFKPFLDAAQGIFHDYQQRKITEEQLRTSLMVLAMETFAKNEATYAEMVIKTWGTYAELIKTSKAVRIAYVYVVVTQATVLMFYQIGVPFIVWNWGGSFPSPGDQLLVWGYGLLVLLCGGGFIAIKRPTQPPMPAPPSKP